MSIESRYPLSEDPGVDLDDEGFVVEPHPVWGQGWLAADPAMPADDPVARPAHYTGHPSGIECIAVSEAFTFNLGNVIKYVWRADAKGDPLTDLRKARWYLDREIARRERGA